MITIINEDDPRNLVNLVPPDVSDALKRLVKYRPALFFMEEAKFKKQVKPDALISRLRISFWDEYCRAQDNNAMINISAVIRNVCSKDYFYEVVLRNEAKLAWLIYPPKDYMMAMREMLDLGLDEWREILALPIQNKRGKVDYKLLSSKLKIVQLLDMRVKGAIVQRLQVSQKNLNVNVDAPTLPQDMSIEELEALERKLNAVSEQAGLISDGTDNLYMNASGRRVANQYIGMKEDVLDVEVDSDPEDKVLEVD